MGGAVIAGDSDIAEVRHNLSVAAHSLSHSYFPPGRSGGCRRAVIGRADGRRARANKHDRNAGAARQHQASAVSPARREQLRSDVADGIYMGDVIIPDWKLWSKQLGPDGADIRQRAADGRQERSPANTLGELVNWMKA